MRIQPGDSSARSRSLRSSLRPGTQPETVQLSQAAKADSPLDALGALAQWAGQATQEEESVQWHPSCMPLKIRIEPLDGQPMNSELYPHLRQWEAASMGLVRFRDVSLTGEPADITIGWTDTPSLGREFEVGHAKRTVNNGGWITKVEITLLKHPEIDKHLDESQRQKRLQATILHEVGHALGLEHGQDKRDVMYYRGWQNTWLSEADCARLQRLYQEGSRSQKA